MIRDNIEAVKNDIAQICNRIKRDPMEITLVAVTKFAEVAQITEAVKAGLTHIGENRVQEGQRKFPEMDAAGLKTVKHLIGHLQTNKVKLALQYFDLIQSVDSLKLAAEIEKQAQKLNRTINILVQVSTSGEEQKFGVEHSQAIQLVEDIAKFEHINIQGLMTIAPLTDNKDIVRKCFSDLRLIRDQLQQNFSESGKVHMKYLSMGMSQDFTIALEEGANMLRIGSAIFK